MSTHDGQHWAPRLHQPWRGAVAAAEVVVTAGLVVLAVLCWRRGILHLEFPGGDNQPVQRVTEYFGNWIAGAVGIATVAGGVFIDAVREVLLATRTRRRPPEVEQADLAA